MQVTGIRSDGRRIEMERTDLGIVSLPDGNFYRYHYFGYDGDLVADHMIEIDISIMNSLDGPARVANEERNGVLGMGFVDVEGLPC